MNATMESFLYKLDLPGSNIVTLTSWGNLLFFEFHFLSCFSLLNTCSLILFIAFFTFERYKNAFIVPQIDKNLAISGAE